MSTLSGPKIFGAESLVMSTESKPSACFSCTGYIVDMLKVKKTCREESDKVVVTACFVGVDTGPPSPTPSAAEMTGLSTTPPRIVHLHPSIRFITIPDSSGYQVVQTLRLSPSVIKFPLPSASATPAYIFGE